MSIVSWNIEGLAKYEFSPQLIEYVRQFDIFGFCETWGQYVTQFDNFISGFKAFTCIRKKRFKKGRASGGVSVFVRCSLVESGFVKRIFSEFDDCVVLLINGRLFDREIDIILCFLYISPEGSSVYSEETGMNGIDIFENKLFEIVQKYPAANIMLAGDFNARCGEHQDILMNDTVDFIFDDDVMYESDEFSLGRSTKDKFQNNFGTSLIELCKEYSIHILNGRVPGDIEGEITCVANEGSSVVDYIVASSALFEFITYFEVGNRTESVHFPLICSLTLDVRENREASIDDNVNTTCNTFMKFRWKENFKDIFLQRFIALYQTMMDRILEKINVNIDEGVELIVSLYQTAAECMKQKKWNKVEIVQEPWWDRQCDQVKKEKFKLLRQFRRNNDLQTLNNYKEVRNKFKDICRQKKLDLQKQNREELIASRKNSSLFWKSVKKFRYKDKQINNIAPHRWVSHFKELLYVEDIGNLLEYVHGYSEDGLYNDTFNAPFTMSEMRISIKSLKLGKAGGPDGIASEMLINTINEISIILLPLYNRILDFGWYPSNWSQSILCPVYKSGSINDPNNYRGVSLIDVLNKILTGMLYKRIYEWAEENSKIDECQAGFRKGYSTTDNLFTLMSMGQKYLSKKGGRFYCLFVDFSKAFDRVNHAELINSLIRKGVHGKFLKLLIAMYSNLHAGVKLENGKCTSYFKCNIGTRQGCKLSTILFSLFINDLVDELKDSGIKGIQVSNDESDILAILYADDMANVSDTVRALQAQIDVISSFCDRTEMKINLSKTKVIVFRNGGFLREYEKWYFNGESIETVSSYKYMGLCVTPKLIWTKAKENLSIQARKSIISLAKLQNAVGYFEYSELFKLFDSVAKPILCYGAELWGFEVSESIERVQYDVCKKFLKLPQCTFNEFARGECGRYPLYVDYFCRCIKYWIKLTRMNVNRFPNKCYGMLRNLDENGRITWASKVRELLFRYGFGYVWVVEDVGNVNLFMKTFKQRLIDCSSQDWCSKITASGKSRHYKFIMPAMQVANYIQYDIPIKFRIALSKLKCSVHSLNVEVGRHSNIPYEQRLCVLCNMQEIEDEFHFVMSCPVYHSLRITYLPNIVSEHVTVDMFYSLFKGNKDQVLSLAKYIYHAFNVRRDKLSEML
ncbi:MAG: reverse transcriptase family protein [Candidatus Thiodiazotropha sp.]